MEVHVVRDKSDFIICHLKAGQGAIQQPLNLEISEGEEISVYICNTPRAAEKAELSAGVHLTGYLVEDPTDSQWEGLDCGQFSDGTEEEVRVWLVGKT